MIDRFTGRWKRLSNFSDDRVIYDGAIWPTAEHAFQAAKTFDPDQKRDILFALTPAMAKRLGRKVTMRDDWNRVKDGIMLDILRAKFDAPELRRLLDSTGTKTLVEGNRWHDNYWGKCYCGCANGVSHNRLGKLLMQVREEQRTR